MIGAARRAGLLVDGRDYFRAFHRAACAARRYILVAGWRFDSQVRLLRGEDAAAATAPVRLLELLDWLCRRNPALHVYLLAWDFSVLFAHDREWLQALRFNWSTGERVTFLFDSAHAIGASHHQKFAVVDGRLAFAGGMDLSIEAWDDRRHLPAHAQRVDPAGQPTEPHHDLQACVAGAVVPRLVELFRERWREAGGGDLDLPDAVRVRHVFPPEALPIRGRQVALSLTRAPTLVAGSTADRSIRALFVDAIAAAERLIYIENQYFSSRAVLEALVRRMRAAGRPGLEIVLVLPRRPHAWIEQIVLGQPQTDALRTLGTVGRAHGHRVGIYCTGRSRTAQGEGTYIHSKLLDVDDRFLTVGSANTTNRSMGLDTELNLTWEARSASTVLGRSIRDVRASLLAEHVGGATRAEAFTRVEGLVERLDGYADNPEHDLRRHDLEVPFAEDSLLARLSAGEALDPERAPVEEEVWERIAASASVLFGGPAAEER